MPWMVVSGAAQQKYMFYFLFLYNWIFSNFFWILVSCFVKNQATKNQEDFSCLVVGLLFVSPWEMEWSP